MVLRGKSSGFWISGLLAMGERCVTAVRDRGIETQDIDRLTPPYAAKIQSHQSKIQNRQIPLNKALFVANAYVVSIARFSR